MAAVLLAIFLLAFGGASMSAGAAGRVVTFSGRVVDAGGKPAGEAAVHVALYDPARTQREWSRAPKLLRTAAGTEGAFRIAVPIANESWTAVVVATKEGHGPGWREVKSPLAPAGLRLTLTRPGFVAGRVVDRTGAPVAGASVTAKRVEMPTPAPGAPLGGVVPAATTDAQGRFRLEPLPDGGFVQLLADHPRSAETQHHNQTRVGTETVTISLPAAGTIRGRVVDAQGRPAANATVYCQRALEVIATTRTDASGEYRFTRLRGDHHLFRAESEALPDLVSDVRSILVPEGGDVRCPDLRFQPGGVVTGRVTDAKGRPEANLLIRSLRDVEVADRHFTTLDGPDGSYRLQLWPGKWRVTPTYTEFGSIENYTNVDGLKEYEIPAEKTTRLDFRVPSPGALRGRVVDPQGRPVAGVSVEAVAGGLIETQVTDPSGRFLFFHRSPSESEIRLSVFNSQRTQAARLEMKPAKLSSEQTIRLRPLTAVTGAVTARAGMPVGEASVSAMEIKRRGFATTYYGGNRTRTDARGRFTLWLFPEATYHVMVGAKGYGSAEKTDLDVGPPGSKNARPAPLRFVLDRADGFVAGTVVDDDGKPLVGAQVEVNKRGELFSWTVATVHSDAQGRFRAENLPPGEVEIGAWLAGYLPGERQPVPVGTRNARIILAPAEAAGARPPLPAVGSPAPEIRGLRWVSGAGVSGLQELRGKRVVLLFSSAFNPAAKAWHSALKALDARLKEAKRQDIVLLGIFDASAPATEVATYASAEGLSFPIGLVEETKKLGHDSATFRAYGVRDLPTVFVIDAEGRVAAVNPTPEEVVGLASR